MIKAEGLYYFESDLGVIFFAKRVASKRYSWRPIIAGLSGFARRQLGTRIITSGTGMYDKSKYWKDDPYSFIKYVFERKWVTV
jgi:hypothetical protein